MGLHWCMLPLLAAVYGAMILSDSFPKGSDARNGLKTWHYMLGMSVFFLVWLRIAVRMTTRVPSIVPGLPLWQRRLSGVVQFSLYLLMVAMPLAGWLALNASGQPVPFLGLQLPVLITENRTTAGLLKEIHEAGATAGYFLLGLHATAALFHHYIVRDNTLRRMLWDRR